MRPWLHRPPENHVSVIYRNGRFRRLASPRQWTFLFFEEVRKDVSMDMRTAFVPLKDVLTRDQMYVDLELKVFFSVDIQRISDPARLLQAVRFQSEEAFEQIVKTNTNDVVRNIVFASREFEDLNSVRGRAWLKENLSREIGERVSGFGIVIGQFGVNIANFQPNATQVDAIKNRSAATVQGEGEMNRIAASLQASQEVSREDAIINTMLLVAAAIAKTGQIPEIVFPEDNGDGDYAGRRPPLRPRSQPPAHPHPLGGVSAD